MFCLKQHLVFYNILHNMHVYNMKDSERSKQPITCHTCIQYADKNARKKSSDDRVYHISSSFWSHASYLKKHQGYVYIPTHVSIIPTSHEAIYPHVQQLNTSNCMLIWSVTTSNMTYGHCKDIQHFLPNPPIISPIEPMLANPHKA